jgi:hypothetical protein
LVIETGVFRKKNVIYGMIALLSVSLFFLGCPTEASDDTNPVSNVMPDGSAGPDLTSPGAGTQALLDALENLPGAGTDFTVGLDPSGVPTITVTTSSTIDSLPPIPPGTKLVVDLGTNSASVTNPINNTGTFTVKGNGTLTVNDDITNSGTIEIAPGATLATTDPVTNNGKLTVGGTITQSGMLDNDGDIVVTGIYNVNNPTTSGTNTGTISVESGGKISGVSGNIVEGDGFHVIKEGGKALYNGNATVGAATDNPVVTLTSGTFSYNYYEYRLDGIAILNLGFPFGGQLSDTLTLTITENGSLTIASGAGVSGSKFGQKIIIRGSLTIDGGGTNNFYAASSGTTEAPATGKTYTWVTDADGGNTDGWKADS